HTGADPATAAPAAAAPAHQPATHPEPQRSPGNPCTTPRSAGTGHPPPRAASTPASRTGADTPASAPGPGHGASCHLPHTVGTARRTTTLRPAVLLTRRHPHRRQQASQVVRLHPVLRDPRRRHLLPL